MSSDADTTNGTAPSSRQALFYRTPEPLMADRHGALRLRIEPDFHFAKDVNAVPITDVEFAAASRFYPIVFTPDPVAPLVVLGLQARNLFVGEDGHWTEKNFYIPACVRRYPFLFIEHPGGFMLGVDRACERITEGDGKSGEPIFVDGKPSAFTRDALNFCAQLQNQQKATRAFGAALAEQNLLIDRMANAVLPDGRRYNVQGFKIVDAERFLALPDAVVSDWHKKGWLGLVHFHLTSLERFRDLLNRMPAAPEPQPVLEAL